MQKIILLILTLFALTTEFSIDGFGAIPNNYTLEAAWANSKAFTLAMQYANSSAIDRTIHVMGNNDDGEASKSSGKNRQYYMMPVRADNLQDVTFYIDGEIVYSDDRDQFPSDDGKNVNDLFALNNCSNITFTGSGTGVIQGQGYWWWVNEFLNQNKRGRPHMFAVSVCKDFHFQKITIRNSPQFHLRLSDIQNVQINNMEIFTDWWGTRSDGKYNWRLPIFPLNTDGIDPSGKNVYIHDLVVQNYDDVVAVKPSHQGRVLSDCSQNMLIERVNVTYGVGMTIGSVPPNDGVNCVRNVTFRDVDFNLPFKAIYIKTNPGDSGSGIIENITYQNMNIKYPIWWGTYIGPQQQHQPDGSGPGCMFYPLIKECQTQPRVPIKDVSLKNIHTTGAVLSPGILRCNETNPCTGFNFEDVTVDGWLKEEGYICENIIGEYNSGVSPAPTCFTDHKREDDY